MGSTRLYSTISVEEQWQAVAGPWLRAQAGAAWKNPKPTVILTPSRAESFYLRSRLVQEGASYLGLRFWTPSDARKFLLAELASDLAPATQAELRLIARARAEALADQAHSNHATIKSVVREPGAFLRAYDLLLGAGWDPAREGADYGRKLAREMQNALEKFHISTQAGLHRHLRNQVKLCKESLLANLHVIGFNATHWPLSDLLQAVVFCADDAVVVLSEPRVFAEKIDQLWISSWEEITKSETRPASNEVSIDAISGPFAALVASYEQGAPSNSPSADLAFRVTTDLTSHIRAVVLQAIDYLKRDSCTRLGIVFAEANALALGVAQELRRLGIPLNDGTGAFMPGLFERRSWQTWLALQEEPGVPRLIAWLRACEAEGISTGIAEDTTVRDVANLLENALGESLVDDLHFLTHHLENSDKKHAGPVADFLRNLIELPDKATCAQFLALTRRAFSLAGWEGHLARLQMDPPPWLNNSDQTFSRRAFLEWLKESTASQTRTRGAEGNHFYGRIHLTSYAQMTGQAWSHLILTGLNEGVWPHLFEVGAFGSRHELVELNRQARALNLRGVARGGQGEGHEIVSADHGHCLLPLERQDLALRDLCAALESTSEAVCLTAMTTEGGRSLLPNDFFNHAWQVQSDRALDEETFRDMALATNEWCLRHDFVFSSNAPDIDGLPLFAQSVRFNTATAYAARRDPTQPFGRFEFAWAQPPAQPIQLSCKRWEDAWNHPATVWLEDIVGASPWPEGYLGWARAMGTWAHRWLASALREWQEKKSSPAELSVLIWAAADRERHAVQRRAREADVELYPWWEQVWAQARSTVLGLGESLAPLLPDRSFVCEFRLPRELIIALPGLAQADFLLNGRIDLLLIEPGTAPRDLVHGDLTGCACWVVDFKTGAAQSLSAKKIAEGKGLQPILYALATHALGATSTAVSLHTTDAPLKHQVTLDAAEEVTAIFRSLDILHRRGIFGMRPDADNAYGYSPAYPIATRFISRGILEAKWSLVHGTAATTSGEAE